MDKRQDRGQSLDGFPRTATQEAELNDMIVATFGRGAGAKCLDYLKSITNAAGGVNATDAELRHYNGQRHLVAIIDARLNAGIKKRREK